MITFSLNCTCILSNLHFFFVNDARIDKNKQFSILILFIMSRSPFSRFWYCYGYSVVISVTASAVGFEPSPRQTGVDLKRAAPCCCRVRSYGKERYRSFGQELKTRNLFRFERVTIVWYSEALAQNKWQKGPPQKKEKKEMHNADTISLI